MPRNARHEFSSLELSALRGNLHSQDDADRERLKHALPNKLGFVQRSMKPNLLLSTSGAPKEFFEFERMPGISTELDGGSSVGPGLSPRGGLLRRKARTMGRSAPVLGSPRASPAGGGEQGTRLWRKVSSHFIKSMQTTGGTDKSLSSKGTFELSPAPRKTSKKKFSFTVQEEKEVEPEILYLHSTWQKVRTLQAIGIKLGRAESSGQFLVRALTSLIYEPLANHKKAKEALLRQLLGYLVDAIGESSKVRSVERFEPLRAAETDAVSLILQYVLYFFDGRVGAHGLPDSCPAAVLPVGEKLSGARQLADAYEAVLKSVSSPPPLPQRELPAEIAQFFYDFFTKVAELAEPESSDEETEEAETTAGHSPATVSPATPVGAANLALEKQPSEALPVTHQTGLHPSEQHPPEKRKFRVPKELVKSSFGPPFRLERHGVVRVKHTNKMQRALLDLAEGISYKALDVMLPAEDQVELGVDKGFFRQKTQDEITNALGRAGGGGGGAASAEAAPGAEGAGGAGKESSGSDAAGPQDPGAPELARPHPPDSTKYHDYAEKCLDHVRGAMQGTINDKKIIRVMNLKQFNLSDFRELLQKSVPVNSTVRKALERLLVLSNHGVMTGAYWNLPLSKQVFTTLLEKGRVCDAATGRQAFELIRGHVAAKRRCICSDFLQKTPNNLVGKNMVCAPQEREKELERERRRLAELMGGEEERLRKEKLRKEREEKRRRAAEMQVRTHMIGVEQLEQFLKNPDPCEKKGISFGAKGAKEGGENKDKEEGGNKDADEDDELNAVGGGLVGGKKKDAKQQEAHKEMLKLLLHPDVLAEMARAEAGEGKLSSEPASGERGAGGSSTIVPRRSSYGGMSADGMGGYGGGSGTGGGQGHGEEIATSSTSKPKFKENAPVTEVSLEDVLVCLGGEIVMDATRNGGTGKAADTSVSGFSNTSETLAAEGGASPVSVAGGFSPVSLAAATSATAAANAVKIRCAKNKPGLEALALLRQKILEKFECTLDAFQNMAFLVSGMSDTSKKTWGHLTLPELQRVLSRIIGEVSVTFVQDLASLVDCPLACGRISLRELLVAVSVISPSLHVEFLRAKMVALHGDLKNGLEELLDPQATVTLIRKRVAEHQKMKRDSQQAGGFGGAGRRSSKSGRSSSKILGSGGTSGVLGDDSRDRRSAAGGSKSSVYSSSGHYGGGSSGGAASGGSLANLAAMPEHLLPGWKNPSSPPAGGSTAITGVDTTIFEESSVSAYPPVPEPSNELYDENTTSGDLDFHRLVNTYAPKNFSSDPVFSKFADEVVMFPAPLRQRSMSLKPGGGGESLGTNPPMTPSEGGRYTPLLLSPAAGGDEADEGTEGGGVASNPYRQKFADVFLLPVHTTDCNRVLSGRMERDQEELCLRENFRYLTESFVGRQLVESDEVLQQFCLTLGFFVERTQQMSLLNRYEAFRVFHAVNVRGRPYLTLSKLQCALQAAGANPIFDQLRAKMHSFFPLLCKAFMSASANRDARCSAADFESLLESLSLTQLDATNVFRSFVQFEFSSLDMWSFINIVLGAMCPSLILEQFAANDTLVAVLQGLAQFHFKPLVFDEFCNLCVNCGILDRRAIQLCFLFCDVDNSECVFPRELLTAFHVKLQLASDDDNTRRSSKKKGSQASAAASAIADTLAREFAGTFAKCDLLKRVVKAPWSAAETEAVQGGFKTLKRLQTTKFGGPAGSGVHKKDNSPPRVPGFRQRRKLHTESEPPAVQVKGETYLNAVEAAPAELLHSDLIFNLEEYAKTKNAVNKQHKSLIEECGQRDMLELYFLRNKL